MPPEPAGPPAPPAARWSAADLGERTEPQPVVEGPATPETRRQAARAMDRVVQLRVGLSLAAAAVLFVVAALLARHSRRFDTFGVLVNGSDPVPVPVAHYAAPWVAGATVAALVAAVVGTLGVVELVRLISAGRRYDRGHRPAPLLDGDHTAGLEH